MGINCRNFGKTVALGVAGAALGAVSGLLTNVYVCNNGEWAWTEENAHVVRGCILAFAGFGFALSALSSIAGRNLVGSICGGSTPSQTGYSLFTASAATPNTGSASVALDIQNPNSSASPAL